MAVIVLFGQVPGRTFGSNGGAAAGKRVGAVGVGQGGAEHKVGDGLQGSRVENRDGSKILMLSVKKNLPIKFSFIL